MDSKEDFGLSMFGIIFSCSAALIIGCGTWELIVKLGEQKMDELKKFFYYKKNIQSQAITDSFFVSADHTKFKKCVICFTKIFMNPFCSLINVFGKTIRRALSYSCNQALSMVTAYCSSNALCLRQEVFEYKSNEKNAIPKLLGSLFFDNTKVSVDLRGGKMEIAENVIDKNGDSIPQFIDNKKLAKKTATELFERNITTHALYDFGHRRIAQRTNTLIGQLGFFDGESLSKNVNSCSKTLYLVFSKKTATEVKSESFSFATSSKGIANYFSDFSISHCSRENRLRFNLDFIFKKVFALKRKGNSSQKFNLSAKMSQTVMEAEKFLKKSKPLKIFKAAMSDNNRQLILKV